MNIRKLLIALGITLIFASPAYAGWSWTPKYLYGSSAVPENPSMINCHYKYFLMYNGVALYEYHADYVVYGACAPVLYT